MAKKTPKEYKPGQLIIVKLSNARHASITYFRIRTEPNCKWTLATMKPRWIETWQVVED